MNLAQWGLDPISESIRPKRVDEDTLSRYNDPQSVLMNDNEKDKVRK